MTVQILIGAVITAVAGIGVAYNMGQSAGYDKGKAEALSAESIATRAANAATNASIEAIKGIRIENKYITKQLDTVVKTEPVYIDCKHSPDAVRLLNSALTGSRP